MAPLSGSFNATYPSTITGTSGNVGSFVPGLVNSALLVTNNGSGAASAVAWPAVSQSMSNFTVALWLSSTVTNQSQVYFGPTISGWAQSYPWQLSSSAFSGQGLLTFSLYTANGVGVARISTATTNWANGDWHLVLGTYDGTHTTLYIDGIGATNQDTVATSGVITNSPDTTFYAGQTMANGSIQNLTLWNHCFNQNEGQLYYRKFH